MFAQLIVQTLLILLTMINNNLTSVGGENCYLENREELIDFEKSLSIGGNLQLSKKELQVNKIVLSSKHEELQSAYGNTSNFLASQYFPNVKQQIEQSNVFKIIKEIPKGASLHTHLLAATNIDFLLNLTYHDHLYGGYINNTFKLRFLSKPEDDKRCVWKSLNDLRQERENESFNLWLRNLITLQIEDRTTVENVWKKFKQIFTTIYEMLCYRPVFEEYIYQILQELYDDNVIYSELKGTFMSLYELNGTIYNVREFFEIFQNIVHKFQSKYPKFIGVRYIHSIYRGVDFETLQENLNELILMKEQFPDFIIGVDLIGYEEEGNDLKYYSKLLSTKKNNLKYFFHAGETNWYGHTDLNLIDAILLDSTRIGHGFALLKHPYFLDLAKQRKIPIELSPISNQALMLIDDLRHHPLIYLVAIDYPLVITNDDPLIWNASGLSYDWYVFYMAMTSKDHSLSLLKKIALNSIESSAVGDLEKLKAKRIWQEQWEAFLDKILA